MSMQQWQVEVERRVDEVRHEAGVEFEKLLLMALSARQRGDEQEVSRVIRVVQLWEMSEHALSLCSVCSRPCPSHPLWPVRSRD